MRRGNERKRGDRHGSAETKSLSACQKRSYNLSVVASFFVSLETEGFEQGVIHIAMLSVDRLIDI